MVFLKLFYVFFKIGLFGFGGGYAMISMIQDEVVNKNAWLSSAEFTDIVAVSQVLPGAIGINTATYVGFSSLEQLGFPSLFCILGSFIATSAVVLPSFVLMIAVSRFFWRYSKTQSAEDVFCVLRPAVIGLILAASLMLMTVDNFGSYKNDTRHFFISIAIFAVVFVCSARFKLSPILLIFLSGLAGFILYQ